MHIKNIIKACGIHLRKYIAPRDMPYALAAILLGFLNHFLYQLSGGAAFIALICPINESVWEHLKLLFFNLGYLSFIQIIFLQKENTWKIG